MNSCSIEARDCLCCGCRCWAGVGGDTGETRPTCAGGIVSGEGSSIRLGPPGAPLLDWTAGGGAGAGDEGAEGMGHGLPAESRMLWNGFEEEDGPARGGGPPERDTGGGPAILLAIDRRLPYRLG